MYPAMLILRSALLPLATFFGKEMANIAWKRRYCVDHSSCSLTI
jgi:hypothetical protein